MSYLEQALHHEPVKVFNSKRANEGLEFFASRGRFLLATSQKIVDIVSTFFKMVFIDTFAAVFDYASGRQDFKDGAKEIVTDLKALPIAFAGIVIGQNLSNRLWNHFHPAVRIPAVANP